MSLNNKALLQAQMAAAQAQQTSVAPTNKQDYYTGRYEQFRNSGIHKVTQHPGVTFGEAIPSMYLRGQIDDTHIAGVLSKLLGSEKGNLSAAALRKIVGGEVSGVKGSASHTAISNLMGSKTLGAVPDALMSPYIGALYGMTRGVRNIATQKRQMKERQYSEQLGGVGKASRGLDLITKSGRLGYSLPMALSLMGRGFGKDSMIGSAATKAGSSLSDSMLNIYGKNGIFGGMGAGLMQSGATAIGGAKAGSAVASMGSFAPMIPLIAAQIGMSMIKSARLAKITANRKPMDKIIDMHTPTRPISAYLTQLANQKNSGMQPAMYAGLQIQKLQLDYLSVLPAIYEEQLFLREEKEKQVEGSQNHFGKHIGGGENKGIFSKFLDKAEYGLSSLQAKFDPFSQIANFLATGQTPKQHLEDLKFAYGGGVASKEEEKEMNKFNVTLGEYRLLTLLPGEVSRFGQSWEEKVILYLQGIFGTTQITAKESINMRIHSGAKSNAWHSGTGNKGGIGNFIKDTISKVPGLSAISNLIGFAGKSVYNPIKNYREGTGSLGHKFANMATMGLFEKGKRSINNISSFFTGGLHSAKKDDIVKDVKSDQEKFYMFGGNDMPNLMKDQTEYLRLIQEDMAKVARNRKRNRMDKDTGWDQESGGFKNIKTKIHENKLNQKLFLESKYNDSFMGGLLNSLIDPDYETAESRSKQLGMFDIGGKLQRKLNDYALKRQKQSVNRAFANDRDETGERKWGMSSDELAESTRGLRRHATGGFVPAGEKAIAGDAAKPELVRKKRRPVAGGFVPKIKSRKNTTDTIVSTPTIVEGPAKVFSPHNTLGELAESKAKQKEDNEESREKRNAKNLEFLPKIHKSIIDITDLIKKIVEKKKDNGLLGDIFNGAKAIGGMVFDIAKTTMKTASDLITTGLKWIVGGGLAKEAMSLVKGFFVGGADAGALTGIAKGAAGISKFAKFGLIGTLLGGGIDLISNLIQGKELGPAAKDAVESMFGGTDEGGFLSSFGTGMTYAAIGAKIGVVGGPPGIIAGALIGGAIGGIIGFIGKDKMKDTISDIKKWSLDPISVMFPGEYGTAWAIAGNDNVPIIGPLVGGFFGTVVDMAVALFKDGPALLEKIDLKLDEWQQPIYDSFQGKYGTLWSEAGGSQFPFVGSIVGGVIGTLIDVIDGIIPDNIGSNIMKWIGKQLQDYPKIRSFLGIDNITESADVSEKPVFDKKKHTEDRAAARASRLNTLNKQLDVGYDNSSAINNAMSSLQGEDRQRMQNVANRRRNVAGSLAYNSIDMNDIGALSRSFESDNSGGSAAVGFDNGGGGSYGKYQIANRPGTLSNFLKFVKDKNPDIYSKLSQYNDYDNTSGQFANTWKSIANSGGFGTLEDDFIFETHYKPAYNKLTPDLQKAVDGNKALQSVVFSRAVQNGSGAATNLNKSWMEANGDLKQFIKNVYSYSATGPGNRKAEEMNAALGLLDRSTNSGSSGFAYNGPPLDPTLTANLKVSNGVNLQNENPELIKRLGQAANELGRPITITSGFRSQEAQQRLNQPGSGAYMPAEAGKSLHNYGMAIDVSRLDAEDLDAKGLLKKYSLDRPFGRKDPVHIIPMGLDQAGLRRQEPYQSGQAYAQFLNSSSTASSVGGSPTSQMGDGDELMNSRMKLSSSDVSSVVDKRDVQFLNLNKIMIGMLNGMHEMNINVGAIATQTASIKQTKTKSSEKSKQQKSISDTGSSSINNIVDNLFSANISSFRDNSKNYVIKSLA